MTKSDLIEELDNLIEDGKGVKTKMAKEAFLINPPKKRKKKSKSKRHRPVVYETAPKTWSRSEKSKSKKAGIKINPLGEEVILVGANPRREKRKTRTTRRGRNAWYGRREKHATAAQKGWRKRKRNPVSANPKRRTYRRRRNRNPKLGVGSINIMKPMTLLMPVASGLAAKMITERVPMWVNIVNPLPKFGVQLAVAIGGGMLLKKPVGTQNATIFTVVGATVALSEVITNWMGTAAMGWMGESYPEIETYGNEAAPELGMGAYPEEISGFGAFPYSETMQY